MLLYWPMASATSKYSEHPERSEILHTYNGFLKKEAVIDTFKNWESMGYILNPKKIAVIITDTENETFRIRKVVVKNGDQYEWKE